MTMTLPDDSVFDEPADDAEPTPIYDAIVAAGVPAATPEHKAWPAGTDVIEYAVGVEAHIAQCRSVDGGDPPSWYDRPLVADEADLSAVA